MQADGQTPADSNRLTAAEVGQRVGEILGAAEREAREIIAAARHEVEAMAVTSGAPLEDVARAIERLTARFDAFELSTAARIEELGREQAASRGQGATPAVADSVEQVVPAAAPEPVEQPGEAAARVRAIDLALAGHSREAIANELAVSLPRAEVETLLDRVLSG